MPAEIIAEVENGSDELADWMKDTGHKKALRLLEEADLTKVQAVLAKYGEYLSETDLIKIGQDPFLIAAALGYADRCVVTAELSKPKALRANRKVPDICNDCGVLWRSPVKFINELDFKTDWES
jgi:hypothetical protein